MLKTIQHTNEELPVEPDLVEYYRPLGENVVFTAYLIMKSGYAA